MLDGTQPRVLRGTGSDFSSGPRAVSALTLFRTEPGVRRDLQLSKLLDHAIFKEQDGQVGPRSVLFVCCVTVREPSIPTGIYHVSRANVERFDIPQP
jgi:hypothetical protein